MDINSIEYVKTLRVKSFDGLGMNINSDRYILPDQYTTVVSEPYFKGKGEHSIRELEELCEKYKEYAHQQAIIKQNLIASIKLK